VNRPFSVENNVKCYISSPGNADGGIQTDGSVKTILRFLSSEYGNMSAEYVVADLIYLVFGPELKQYCHISNEPSIIRNLIKTISLMEIDLRVIMDSSPIFDSNKHLRKLGLSRVLPGMCQPGHDRPDRFMRKFVWKSGNNSILSQGMGVNMWTLLTLASLVGNDSIHCKSRGRAAQSILSQILKMSPASTTPGNMVPIRSFHEKTNKPEFVCVPGYNRCDHFLRPINDQNFATHGVFSYCKHIKGHMPEDYLGVSGVLAISFFLQCDYKDVPPSQVKCHYNLIPERYHHIHKRSEDKNGNIYLHADGVHVTYDDDTCENWDCDEWEHKLREHGFLVMPTIWRSGALVLLPDGSGVGCPVPSGTRRAVEDQDGAAAVAALKYISNYDHINMGYHLLVEENTTTCVSVMYVLDNLVVPGKEVWIKGGSQAWEDLREFLPSSDLSQDEADKRMIKARLNVPLILSPVPGIIYLTVLERPSGSAFASDISHRHVTASPWELSATPPPDPSMRISELWI